MRDANFEGKGTRRRGRLAAMSRPAHTRVLDAGPVVLAVRYELNGDWMSLEVTAPIQRPSAGTARQHRTGQKGCPYPLGRVIPELPGGGDIENRSPTCAQIPLQSYKTRIRYDNIQFRRGLASR
jgi:hypothetical protein